MNRDHMESNRFCFKVIPTSSLPPSRPSSLPLFLLFVANKLCVCVYNAPKQIKRSLR